MKEILPAHCAYYTREYGLQISCYWQLEAQEHKENFAQTAEHVRFLLTDAIQRQLVSDVPIGTFLSGGLDSSLISSVAAREFAKQGRTLHTFSVDYRDNDKYFKKSKFQPNSDPEFIRHMQSYLNAEHHWTVIDTPQLAGALYDAVQARDLPGMVDVDASLLLFCKEIKQHVTVALSGECADELFGGYPWYRDPEIRAAYGFPWSQSTAYRLTFAKPEIAQILEKNHDIDHEYQATLQRTALLPGESGTEKRMKEMMRLNLDWFMQTLLERNDIKENKIYRRYFNIYIQSPSLFYLNRKGFSDRKTVCLYIKILNFLHEISRLLHKIFHSKNEEAFLIWISYRMKRITQQNRLQYQIRKQNRLITRKSLSCQYFRHSQKKKKCPAVSG